MANKLFISYNHKDKEIIDTIARRLDIEFGRSNIFYDAWSINPGDSIIGAMSEGLSAFDSFFFFMSENSLCSNMVKLEWQSALNRSINQNLKFVGIRLDNCQIPTILSDKLYIDLYNEGIDATILKMKAVINNENSYTPLDNFKNIYAIAKQISSVEVEIEVHSKRFAEHDITIAIGFDVDFHDIIEKKHFETLVIHSENIIEMQNDGEKFNCYIYKLQRTLKPGYPFKIKLKSSKSFRRIRVFEEKIIENDCAYYEVIPCTLNQK